MLYIYIRIVSLTCHLNMPQHKILLLLIKKARTLFTTCRTDDVMECFLKFGMNCCVWNHNFQFSQRWILSFHKICETLQDHSGNFVDCNFLMSWTRYKDLTLQQNYNFDKRSENLEIKLFRLCFVVITVIIIIITTK